MVLNGFSLRKYFWQRKLYHSCCVWKWIILSVNIKWSIEDEHYVNIFLNCFIYFNIIIISKKRGTITHGHSAPISPVLWVPNYYRVVASPYWGAGQASGKPLCPGLRLPAFWGRSDTLVDIGGTEFFLNLSFFFFCLPSSLFLFSSFFRGGRFSPLLFFLAEDWHTHLYKFKYNMHI